MRDLYIIGAGGFGKEVACLVERINEKDPQWNLCGFLDDDGNKHGTMCFGYPVIGGTDCLKDLEQETYVVCAIGTAKIRKKIINKIKEISNLRFATLIDPSVIISKKVTIGEGDIICAGTVFTVDIVLGCHVIIDLNCTVGHDVHIGDFVTAYPGVNISGNCCLGEATELGTGAQIIQGCSSAPGSIIGAGAVVVSDITTKGTYVGVPARLIIK